MIEKKYTCSELLIPLYKLAQLQWLFEAGDLLEQAWATSGPRAT